VELAAVIAQTARAEPATAPPPLRAVMRGESCAVFGLLHADAEFQRVLASRDGQAPGLPTAPELLAFSGTLSNLGVVLSMAAYDEAVSRDHAARELREGRASVTPGGAIFAADDAALYPRPEAAPSAGMLALVVRMAAALIATVTSAPPPGWQPLRAPLQRDVPLLQAVIAAEQGFRQSMAGTGAADAPPPEMAAAISAFCQAIAHLAVTLMESAAVEAARRDHAMRELIAGRAWAAPDGSIIKAPNHAA
jgi:hypothetical protein